MLKAAITGVGCDPRPVSPRVLLIGMASLVITALILGWANASIYADGSWYLLSLIHTGHPMPIAGREAVNYLKELPAWLGVGAGITNVRLLTALQSLGFLGEPLVVWCAALWAARRSALLCSLVLLAAAVCFGTGSIFSVNELNLTLALLVLVSVCLVDDRPWSVARTATCIVASLVLVWAYEFMVAWGPLLAGLAGLRFLALRRAGKRREAVPVALIGVLAIVAVAVAVYTLIFHQSPNAEGFGSGLIGKPYTAGTQVIAVGALLAAFVIEAGPRPRRRLVASLLVAAAVLLAVHSALLWGRPSTAYTARSWPSVLVLLLMLGAIGAFYSPRSCGLLSRAGGRLLPAALAFCVLSMVSPVIFAVGFHRFTGDVQHALIKSPGQLIEPRRALASGQQKYTWSWANESLSLLLRSAPSDGILLNTQVRGGYEPFPLGAVHRQIDRRYRS